MNARREFAYRLPNTNPVGCVWGLIKWACFIALAVHLGWSWWLLALIIVLVEVTFS